MPVRSTLRRVLPAPAVRFYARLRINSMRRRYGSRPRAEVFEEIYRKNLWGGSPAGYCSGEGSTTDHAGRYAAAVKEFIADKKIESVVDVGCGDFTVGALIRSAVNRYVGVDIVPELVARNERLYGSDSTSFVCLDAVTDPPPPGDLALVRQVMQHLSNAEISLMLANLEQYPYVLVTEHYPTVESPDLRNLDMPHGPDIRGVDGSAVYPEAPPFEANVVDTLLEVEVGGPIAPGDKLRTVVIENRT